MAVLHQSDAGYFVCHRSFSLQICGRSYKRTLFDIRTPFLKDLEAISEAQAIDSGVPKRRKRKRNHHATKELPLEESTVLTFLAELQSFFQPPPLASDFVQNNKIARNTVSQFLSSLPGSKFQESSLEIVYQNSTEHVKVKELSGEIFILPAESQFYKKDIGYSEILAQSDQKFSLIVIDPPWTNRFVKRKRDAGGANSYRSLDNDILSTLPISRLCAEGALVAVWCTNSKTHLDFLTYNLLPSWNLTYVATWFWIKVTISGKFVCAWNGPSGKQPFERLILARKMCSSANQHLENPSIPDKQLVVSVPCAIHSFKPPLQKLLKPFLQISNNCSKTLELFARSLLPNTVSLGNQVPLLQHVDLFED